MIPLLLVVVTGTAACLIHTCSATMAVTTGWTGKISVHKVTRVTELNIRIMMRMASAGMEYLSIHTIYNEVIDGMKATGIS